MDVWMLQTVRGLHRSVRMGARSHDLRRRPHRAQQKLNRDAGADGTDPRRIYPLGARLLGQALRVSVR